MSTLYAPVSNEIKGGSGWESNPPRPATRPATGFEDQEAHRDLTTPARKHTRTGRDWQVREPKRLYDTIRAPAPVAQWTECRPPEPKSAVRVCARAPNKCKHRRKAVFVFIFYIGRDTISLHEILFDYGMPPNHATKSFSLVPIEIQKFTFNQTSGTILLCLIKKYYP